MCQLRPAPRGTQCGFDRWTERRASFGIVENKIQVSYDGGEQVVEVMRATAGGLADSLHLLRLTQLVFGFAGSRDVRPVGANAKRHSVPELHRDLGGDESVLDTVREGQVPFAGVADDIGRAAFRESGGR